MLKKNELADPTSCLSKADANEPVFVLRAKDLTAPQTVRIWAAMAEDRHEPAKVREALEWAAQAEAWRKARYDAEGKPHPKAVEDAPAPVASCTAVSGREPLRLSGRVSVASAPNCSVAGCFALSEPGGSRCPFHADKFRV